MQHRAEHQSLEHFVEVYMSLELAVPKQALTLSRRYGFEQAQSKYFVEQPAVYSKSAAFLQPTRLR
jgi:hypothetical protein